MLRQDLLNALNSVKSALGGSKSMVPIHPCFCVTGKKIFTYDDTAALVVNFDSPWKGGVRGEALVEWLSACGAKELETELDGTTLKLKCGRAHAELPILGTDDFLFDPPELTKAPHIKLTVPFMAALRRVALAMGSDGQHPWRCGVQIVLTEKMATLYACDEASAAKAYVEIDVPKELRNKTPLLPPRFVELVLKTSGEGDLWITDEWFAASVDTGVTLFSAVPTGVSVKTFQDLFAPTIENRKKSVPLPKTWWGALKRAGVLLAGEKEAPATCKIEGGKMTLSALSQLGNSRDSFKLEGDHHDTEVRLPPAIALRPGQDEAKLVDKFFIAEGPRAEFYGLGWEYVVASGS